MNKKATQKLLSVWWFFVLTVVGAGIVIGVLIYYSADADLREAEANILSERIANCLVEQGYLQGDFSQNFNIFEKCGLKKEVFDAGTSFYLKISVYDEAGNLFKGISPIVEGDRSFEKDCQIEEKISARYFPRCAEKKELFLYKENEAIKKGRIEILAGSNQVGKKIALA